METTHLGIARMDAATWRCDWHLPRPHMSKPAWRAVFARTLLAVMAFTSLFVMAEWCRPDLAPSKPLKIPFTAETVDGRPVTWAEWTDKALAANS